MSEMSIHHLVQIHELVDKAGGDEIVLEGMKTRLSNLNNMWGKKKSHATRAREFLITLSDSQQAEFSHPCIGELQAMNKGISEREHGITRIEVLSAFLTIGDSTELLEWLVESGRGFYLSREVHDAVQGLQAMAVVLGGHVVNSRSSAPVGFSVSNKGAVTIHKRKPRNLVLWTDHSWRIFTPDRECSLTYPKKTQRGYYAMRINQDLVKAGEYDSDGMHITDAKVYHPLNNLFRVVNPENLLALANRAEHLVKYEAKLRALNHKKKELNDAVKSHEWWFNEDNIKEMVESNKESTLNQTKQRKKEHDGALREMAEYEGWFD